MSHIKPPDVKCFEWDWCAGHCGQQDECVLVTGHVTAASCLSAGHTASLSRLQSYLWIHQLPGCLFQQLRSSERYRWAPSSAQCSGRDMHESCWLQWRQEKERERERPIFTLLLTYFLVTQHKSLTQTEGNCAVLRNQTTRWVQQEKVFERLYFIIQTEHFCIFTDTKIVFLIWIFAPFCRQVLFHPSSVTYCITTPHPGKQKEILVLHH